MSKTCIYCGYQGKLSIEHSLPRGLGNFQGRTLLHDRVCRDCNTHIGQTDEQFLRAGPTGFLRYMSEQKTSTNPFYRGSTGAAACQIRHADPETGIEILWELKPGTTQVFPMRQIVVRTSDGQHVPVPIPERIQQADALRAELESRELGDAQFVFYRCAADEEDWIKRLIEPLCREGTIVSSDVYWDPQPANLVTTTHLTTNYFRAIAKIGFHYSLEVFPNIRGSEAQFAAIRAFILHGRGEHDQFVQDCKPFVPEFNLNYLPDKWIHVVMAEQDRTGITFRAQFFVGPGSLPPCFKVFIGENPSQIILPRPRRMHCFIYLDSQAPTGFDGVVEEYVI